MRAFLHDVKHDVVVASTELGELTVEAKEALEKLKAFLNKEAHNSALRGYLQLVFANSFDYVQEDDDSEMTVKFNGEQNEDGSKQT